MKKYILSLITIGMPLFIWAQTKAITTNGDTVLLYKNNTWQYKNWQTHEMIYIQGGSFMMGSEWENADKDERPVHKVTLNNYYIGKYEVTVQDYRAFCEATGHHMPELPPWGWIDEYPVVNVTWYDAVGYCEWLSKLTGRNYHLPSEAQWEFAAIGGLKAKGFSYSGSEKPGDVAWFADNTNLDGPRSVGTKRGNELGIYDMSGNVAEWCQDFYDKEYYGRSISEDPKGPNLGTHRLVRGGSWKEEAWRCRSTFRYINTEIIWYNFMGFRLAMDEN